MGLILSFGRSIRHCQNIINAFLQFIDDFLFFQLAVSGNKAKVVQSCVTCNRCPILNHGCSLNLKLFLRQDILGRCDVLEA